MIKKREREIDERGEGGRESADEFFIITVLNSI